MYIKQVNGAGGHPLLLRNVHCYCGGKGAAGLFSRGAGAETTEGSGGLTEVAGCFLLSGHRKVHALYVRCKGSPHLAGGDVSR